MNRIQNICAVALTTCVLDACSLVNLKPVLSTTSDHRSASSEKTLDSESSEPARLDEQDQALSSDYLNTLCYPPPEPELASWRELDIFDRLRDGFQLDSSSGLHARTKAELRWFKRHPEYISRVVKRGGPYWYFVTEELHKRDMPLEIALLPIVESGFDPFAYSPGRASGMWQIIPGTARELGLDKNWWFDARRDVIASTEAALGYLQGLNRRFDGDWLLALAAYNSGGTRVQRAIDKNIRANKPTDYWHLALPKETAAYVPRLLALVELFSYPERHGVTIPTVANTAYFDAIDIGSQLDLAQAADLADISIDEVYTLNPALNRWATPPEGPHRLLVPAAKSERFRQALAQLPVNQRVTWRRHKIKRGETLSHIAKKHQVSIETLKNANKLSANTIRAGKTLLVPKAARAAERYTYSAEQRLQKIQNQRGQKSKHKVLHKVARGDSYWSISRKYGVSTSQLARWNKRSLKDVLSIGQTLVVWTPSAPATRTNNANALIRKVSYRVRKGDSLAKIANKFRVSVNDISRWNDINQQRYIQPGQPLVLYVNVKS